MKILFFTWADGGNSTPVLGLGTRLASRGHEVTVVSPDGDHARFRAVGLEHARLDASPTSVLRAIEHATPDRVVVDFMMSSWLSQAEASWVPTTALVHTLHDRVDAGILTAFTTVVAINEERRVLGLDPIERPHDLLDRADQVLVTAPRTLDTTTTAGANVRFVGTVLEEPGPDIGWVPPAGEGRPLIVVAMGTTVGLGDDAVIARVVDALAPLSVTTLVTVGPHLDRSTLAVPPNASVSGYVRHAAVMPHAALVVTHAGLGTVLASLSAGVPLVCIPLGHDQPHNAARVEAVGAGVAREPDASVEVIRDAVTRVLGDGRYRAAAAPFRDDYDPDARAAIAALEESA